MDPSNPFVISKTEEDVEAGEHHTHDLDPADEVTVEKVGNVEDLIPLCAKHATGPQISTATFGYDIAQMERRPWDDPAAKQSDYFNYGFNETSWRLYCAMQSEGEESLVAKANEMLRKLKVAAHPEGGAPAGEDHGHSEGVEPYDAPVAGERPYGGYDRRGGGGNYHGNNNGGDHRMFYKTKICQRFQEGRCNKGADCNYAHGIDELRTAPAAAGGAAGYGLDDTHHREPLMQGGGYMPPQQYIMPPFQTGGNMGPMPMYDSSGRGDQFHMGPKRPRGEY